MEHAKLSMVGLILALAIVLLGVGTAIGQQTPERNNNVLFIAVDDLRPDLGAYGDTIAITPNIDKLAKRGIIFTRAYAQQSVCAPSRASLMTGRRPNTTKVWDLDTHFREALPEVVTLPQHFKKHGYHAQAIGKIYHDPASAKDSASWSAPAQLAVTGAVGGKYVLEYRKHNGWKARATERVAVPDNNYIDGRVTEAAIETLRELVKDEPFFLAVGFRRPHLPFSVPEKYWDLYERSDIPLPLHPHLPKNVPEIALHNWKELRGYTDIPDEGPLSKGKIKELRHGYYASVSFIDAQIGRLLDELDRLGLWEQTIVVLWSDHGYHLGEHNLWAKTTNFELDTRVPLIIAAPGQKQSGAKTDALVELVDVYPTLVELAGLPMPEGLEGISMVPLLEKPQRPWKDAAFSQFPRPWFYKDQPDVMGYTMRTDRYRYTEWVDFETGEVRARELYDHKKDPAETINRAGQAQYTEVIERMSRMLQAGWQEAVPISLVNAHD